MRWIAAELSLPYILLSGGSSQPFVGEQSFTPLPSSSIQNPGHYKCYNLEDKSAQLTAVTLVQGCDPGSIISASLPFACHRCFKDASCSVIEAVGLKLHVKRNTVYSTQFHMKGFAASADS